MADKLKICIVPQAVPNPNGGVYHHCVDLLDLLKDSQTINANMLPSEIAVKPFLGKFVFDNKQLHDYIKNCDADLIHVHGFAVFSAVQTMMMCVRLNKPVCYSPHFHPFKYLRRPFLGKSFFNLILRPFLNKLAGIITINNTDTGFLKKYNEHVFRIPHYFKAFPDIKNNVERHPKRILFVGRHDSNKGIEYLESIPQEYELVCVIDKPINRDNTAYYSNISSAELCELYKSASLVVVPSLYEAFSYAALESLACGTPVLISDHVEIGSYIAGEKGVHVFKYGDMDEFLEKIGLAIGDSVDSEKICNIFSPTKIRHDYEQAYGTMCSMLKG